MHKMNQARQHALEVRTIRVHNVLAALAYGVAAIEAAPKTPEPAQDLAEGKISCGEFCEEMTRREMELTRPDEDLRLAFDGMIDGVQCNDVEYLRSRIQNGDLSLNSKTMSIIIRKTNTVSLRRN